MKRKSAAIYARVSSEGERQSTDRQVLDLQSYARAAGLDVVLVFTEKASGARDDRPVLEECVAWCCEGNAGTLLVSEISRLGRTVKIIVDTVDRLTKAGVNIHIHDINIDTLLPSGEENLNATMLVTMLGLGAQMERKLIMGRLNSGRRHAIENGVKMGRKPGSVKSREQIEKEYAKVIRMLRQGMSVRNTAEACGVSAKTVQKVKKEFV
ncbi:MAG: recombinase family protein [Bacteroidales bacterium]|nr:recombinase family protein [Bacteroidales bacterium]